MHKNNISVKGSDLYRLVRNGIEETLSRTEPILERFEILTQDGEDANALVRKIYVEYLEKYKAMSRRKEKETICLGSYTFMGCNLYFYVDDSEWPNATKPCYKGSFCDRGDGYQSITITFNNVAMQTFYSFRSALLHELTHLLDSKRRKTTATDQGWYKMERRFVNPNPITNIIYRLWTAGERNAYTTYGYNKDNTDMKEYIKSLKDQIDGIERSDGSSYSDDYWREVGKYLFPDRLKPNTPVSAIKNLFIKKSRHLLRQFEKKCWQRHGQHYNDPNITPDMKNLNYEANNRKVIEDLRNGLMWDGLKVLSKNNQGFDEWFAMKKVKYPKLTRKLAKYVWDNDMPSIAKAIYDYDPSNESVAAWVKKIGMFNNL